MYNRSFVPISNITTSGAKWNILVRSKSLIFFTVLPPTPNKQTLTCFRSKVLLAWS